MLELFSKEEILDLFNKRENNKEESPEEIEKARNEIKKTLEILPAVIPAFTSELKRRLMDIGFDTGKVSVYLVGGNIKGKPLFVGSDIDLKFAFEKPPFPISQNPTVDAKISRKIRFDIFKNFLVDLCLKHGIIKEGRIPGRFQIMDWGGSNPKDLEAHHERINEPIRLIYTG
jgi:hypothetical protein